MKIAGKNRLLKQKTVFLIIWEGYMVRPLTHQACELKTGTWLDFRDDVRKVEQELFNIIERINPNKKYRLIKARYLYGEPITNLGTICVPDKRGQLVRLDNVNVVYELKNLLGYCPTPLTLQLNNASEVFVETKDRIIPINVFMPGDLFGLYEVLVPFTNCPAIPCWNITSGSRSVFLAAKISDAIGHKKIRKEFNVPAEPPKRLMDHWEIIKTIANSEQNNLWTSEILIFTSDWIELKKNDINWLTFQNYLFKKAWWQSRGNRIQVEYSIIWEAFSKAICSRNLKPNSYLVDTIKHLLMLASGALPGFKFADKESELLLPAQLVEKVYPEIYELKEYAALLMLPHILGASNNSSSIFYSMAYPTLLGGTPAIRKAPNIIEEIREVMRLMAMFKKIVCLQEDRVFEVLKKINFEYFHSNRDRFGEISISQNIVSSDASILAIFKERFAGKRFPAHGQFFRGCIKLSKL